MASMDSVKQLSQNDALAFPATSVRLRNEQLAGEIACILLRELDADTMAQAVFDKLRGPLKLDVYFHHLVSEDGTYLRLASAGGSEKARAAMGTRLDFGEAVSGYVAQNCHWMYLHDVQQRSDDMTGIIREMGVSAYTCEPLISQGQVLGTFSFGSIRRGSFGPDELQLFHLIAEQLMQATVRRVQRERFTALEREAAAGRMSATLAHEINNPLETLSGLLFLLQDEVTSDQGQELLRSAERAVSKLSETAQCTLNHFRGKKEALRPLLLAEFVDETLANITLPGNIPVDRSCEPGLCVQAVPGELRQVVFNLLINAAQFTPPGCRISLEVRSRGNNAEVLVSDEGPGISRESRARMFQPYHTTRKNGGTGLGLWVSREIVTRMHGTLTFLSDPDARPGTTFVLALPLLTQGSDTASNQA